MNFFIVALGGFAGSMSRYYLSVKVTKRLLGTWIANMTGSLLLGLVLNFHLTNMISDALWLLLGIGFCGAYTTFSTFGNETLILIFEKRFKTALAYVFSSIFVSFFVVILTLSLL